MSLVQKGQTSGCSMQWMQWNSVYSGEDIVFDAKRSNQWMQWVQSHSGHSTQWTQWMQYTVDAVHSGIVVYGGGDIVFGAKRSNQ